MAGKIESHWQEDYYVDDIYGDDPCGDEEEMEIAQEVVFGRVESSPDKKVGDDVWCSAAAPGCGHCVYHITRIEDGIIYAVVTEDNMRVMSPEECE